MEFRYAAAVDVLEKSRRGLAIYAGLVLVLTAASFAWSERILAVLVRLIGRKLVAYSPAEAFTALLSLAFYCGITLSLPVGAWLVWRGVVSRFAPAWRGWGAPVILTATALFASGVLLGYYVLLPSGIGFLVGFETEKVRALISARRFVSFCGAMLLALGLAFEAPLVSYFLARFGILKPSFFRNRWRHAVLICVVLAAIITPTPDVWNMTLMTLPLLGLYFVSFLVVAVAGADRPKEP